MRGSPPRLILEVLAVLALGSAVASATAEHRTPHHTRLFWIAGGKTRTFRVSYPDALKYGQSRYSGSVSIVPPPSCGPKGNPCPKMSKVRVLSKGSCDGGSDFCARVRNTNAEGMAAVGVRLQATTRLPPGSRG